MRTLELALLTCSFVTVAFAAPLGCGGAGPSPAGPAPADRHVQAGTWGGDHIGLEVSATGATVEYDCAHGTIDGALALDGQGRFEARGSHVAERGGPVREGDAQRGVPARYRGTVSGDTMTLTVTLDGGEEVGTFTLTRGRTPRIRKCL
jgi:hypothetical protein